jgi:predicted phage terminase large subunit-like protein
VPLGESEMADRVAPLVYKLAWFKQHGYEPHYFQTLFHTMRTGDKLTRFRHLVAGRRGGKTLSAAWEVLFYLLHPEFFHLDAHNAPAKKRSLWMWQLSKDYKVGFAALHTFREVVTQCGLVFGKDYKENRGDKFFEFYGPDGNIISRIDFKSADDPQSLRGAGLDILWMDEAAFIPNRDAYDVVRPALSDKLGLVVTTTTPDGKNWFFDEFWSERRLNDPKHGRVEYTSIHNPHFSEEEWLETKETYHPLLFRQEYMASFDSMAGLDLSGEWLHFYELDELPRKGGKLDLALYMGVDPAISTRDTADRFVMTLIGVRKDNSEAFLIEQYADRIPFAEQVERIQEWFHKYKPQLIGIEATAYQAALAQQVSRLAGLAPIIPMQAKGKKHERIFAMAPLFKIGKVKITREHKDFIDEWINYDSSKKHAKDDTLDSMEIALRTAGALLAESIPSAVIDPTDRPPLTIEEEAWRAIPSGGARDIPIDDHLGGEW